METVYWTMKNGKKISVDDMDINHLRNTLKLIVKAVQKGELQRVKPVVKSHKFEIHGEIAQDHIDQGYLNEQEEYDPRDDIHFF